MATERREADFYPTPPCAVEALRLWFVGKFGTAPLQERWLDPAAGAGSLLHWFGVPLNRRYALEFREGEKVIVNPGSVGQPRDTKPEASYAIMEVDDRPRSVKFFRIPYDIDAVKAKIFSIEKLDNWLGERLTQGR